MTTAVKDRKNGFISVYLEILRKEIINIFVQFDDLNIHLYVKQKGINKANALSYLFNKFILINVFIYKV